MRPIIIALLVVSTIGYDTAHAASCDGFVDVDSSATYCTAVTYVQMRGVTIGCTDDTHYCPNDYVTRAQMALFLQRMGRADSTNTIIDHTSAVGGGIGNTSGSSTGSDAVGGGDGNSATGGNSTVIGGQYNIASAVGATVLGGIYNEATNQLATVIGGADNTASGNSAIAAGRLALADQSFCTVFDLWPSDITMSCGGSASIFRIGGTHGLSIDFHTQEPSGFGSSSVAIGDLTSGQMITTSSGAFLSNAGVWTNVSDRNAKEGFTPIDQSVILDRVVHMPVERWRYKAEPDATHIGPVAQDFYAAFNVGTDDRHITPIDEGGVAFAAIQALNAKVEARDAVISSLAAKLQQLAEHMTALEAKQ